ncbi:hypothetical protein DFQ00_11318 [Paenibacillus barcinonensis]|uniref:Uncharacterized protein n=1 Tax=Paenibacillus barcinonensis TaxID=198119 RepID=A0A2V4V4Q6_PAEBA|nr:hypothetical protein DFQ00_11318 [Paenibacillus barcinonensis]
MQKSFSFCARYTAVSVTGMESEIKGYRSSTFYGRIVSEYSKGQEQMFFGRPICKYVRTYLRGSYLYVSSQCTENM